MANVTVLVDFVYTMLTIVHIHVYTLLFSLVEDIYYSSMCHYE